MGVSVRKRRGKWYVFVNHHGQRKAKSVGSRAAAEKIKGLLEARLALGDAGFLADQPQASTFGDYADRWLKEYARVECKPSTADGYKSVIEQYLRPRFGKQRLDGIKRDQIKAMISELLARELSRNTIRNALCVLRSMFNYAIESDLVSTNPAAKLGKFTRTAKVSDEKRIALTSAEVQQFLEAAQAVCPEYAALFLVAVRAGLRRGELVALRWGDLQFGSDEEDRNRYLYVRHNYVRGEHTTPKSKKSRRVDMSRELRRALVQLRDERLLTAYANGQGDLADDLVFPSPDGSILDPDNLYHRYFLRCWPLWASARSACMTCATPSARCSSKRARRSST